MTSGDTMPYVLRMTMLRAHSGEDKSEAFLALLADLAGDYRSVLKPALEAQSLALGLGKDPQAGNSIPTPAYLQTSTNIRAAEIFVVEKTMYVLMHRISPRGVRTLLTEDTEGNPVPVEVVSTINLYALGADQNPAELAEFVARTEKALDLRLAEWHKRSERFQELLAEGRLSIEAPSEEEVAAAQVLSDRTVRTLATAIKSSSGLLVGDAAKQLPTDQQYATNAHIASLQASDLVATETVVVCRKTNTQVNRLPSAEVIAQLDEAGVRCSCGRSLSEERAEEALAITEQGRSLLDGNRWFTIVLVNELLDLGVPADSILVEQADGGDEMDCIAAVTGDMILFELKDKAFNLGNAYSFGAKIGIMRPDVSVVVTTEHVGGDARDHFERARAATDDRRRARFGAPDETRDAGPIYVEGIDSLRPALERLITQVTVEDARRVLADVMPFATVRAGWLLEQWPPPALDLK